MAKKSRKKRNTGFRLIAFVILLLFGIVTYNRSVLEEERKEKEAELQNLQVVYAREQERTLELDEEKAYRQTKKYIEELAREKIGLVYEDEIIFEENSQLETIGFYAFQNCISFPQNHFLLFYHSDSLC